MFFFFLLIFFLFVSGLDFFLLLFSSLLFFLLLLCVLGALRVIPGGNQVDGLPPEPSDPKIVSLVKLLDIIFVS